MVGDGHDGVTAGSESFRQILSDDLFSRVKNVLIPLQVEVELIELLVDTFHGACELLISLRAE